MARVNRSPPRRPRSVARLVPAAHRVPARDAEEAMTDTTIRSDRRTVFNLCLIYLSWLYSSDAQSREVFARMIRERDRERREFGIPSIGG